MDKAEREFVWKRGMLGVGLPVAVMMAITTGFQVPGYLFRLQSFHPKTFCVALVLFVPIFLVAGAIWGVVVYRLTIKKGRP